MTARMMMNRRALLGGVAGGVAAGTLLGRRAFAAQNSGGFSPEELKAVTAVLQAAVDRGDVGGIVTLIYRRGEVAQVDAVGLQDQAKKVPMSRGSIFRIASMTKPVTSTAAMMLVEEGKMKLEDPVDKWLPELALPKLKVMKDPGGPLSDTRPAKNHIRVVDVFTHRTGIVTPRTKPGPLFDALAKADAENGTGWDVWLKTIGDLPLAYEPGETYNYGNSVDVLGILVERASGTKYLDFLQNRIFNPLGMNDTAFYVPAEKQARAAKLQSLGRVPAAWIPDDRSVPGFISAAGGIHSTVDDYLKFARMLIGKGALGNTRLIKEQTFQQMVTNHLTPKQRKEGFVPEQPANGYWDNQGFGLGLAIKDGPGRAPSLGMASIGSFCWPGAFGTWWQADPKEDMILIFMVPGGKSDTARWAFQEAAYAAIKT